MASSTSATPMTRKYRLMPYPKEEATLVGSACDVSRERFNVELAGYHQTSCDKANGTFICSVFDSESNKWRKFDSLVDAHFTRMNKNQVRVSLRGPPLAYRQFLHTPAPFEGSSLEEDDTAWWGRLRGVRARPGNRPLYLLEFEGLFRWFRYQRRGWPSRCCRITIPGGPAFGRSGQSSMHEGLSAGNLADQSDSCACMYSWPLISRFWRIRGRTECGSICFLWTTGSRYLETRQVLMSECKTRIQRTLKTVSVTILKPREMGQTWEILNVQGLKNKLAKILGLGRHIWYRSRMYPTRKGKEKLRPSSVSALSPGGMVLLQIPNFFDFPLLLCSG